MGVKVLAVLGRRLHFSGLDLEADSLRDED